MKKNYLNKEQIDCYKRDGAIIVRDVFEPWIETLKIGFEKVLEKPGIHARENVTDNNAGRFFEDYCNWQRIPEFKKCIEQSPGAQIVGEATGSKSIQVFHEHIFIKDPGTDKRTPWHQDMPYYCVEGEDTGSYWIPLDPISKENTLQILLGSHKWPKLVRPTKWSNDQLWYENDTEFMDMPNIETVKKNIMIPDLKIGDAVLFNFKIVHGSPGNTTMNPRRAFSMRFIGDDVHYVNRGGETSPPFIGINLETGATMRKDWFPIVWSN